MQNNDKIGKYEILGILGEGGMGIVYKARDPFLDRLVAIKTIRVTLLEGQTGEELRQRFRREAQAEGRLIHPNIIAIYEYQEDEQGMPFFVMEYVEGKSLKEYISRGMLFNLEKSVYIVEQMLSALSYSHSKGIIHRDIKPANIMLLEDDSVKIADFGISKIEGSEFTQTGQVMGTPQYISPEQRLGKRTDGRADLYSTGAVLYELLTGVKALMGNSFAGVTSRLTKEDQPSKLDTKDPATMRVYKLVVLKSLEKDPDDRFGDADEFIAALKDALVNPKKKAKEQSKWLLGGGALGAMVLAGAFYLSEPSPSTPETGPTGKVRPLRTTPVTAEEQSRIDRHLKVGDMHAKIGRLLLPEGSSAYHSYDLALNIDPKNAAALAGMESLLEQTHTSIETLIKTGSWAEAASQLNIAQMRFKGDRKLAELRAQLEDQSGK